MTAPSPSRRLPKSKVALMVAIDVVGFAIGLFLFFWLQPKDQTAAIMGLIAPLVFAGFFNLVIVLVALKP